MISYLSSVFVFKMFWQFVKIIITLYLSENCNFQVTVNFKTKTDETFEKKVLFTFVVSHSYQTRDYTFQEKRICVN